MSITKPMILFLIGLVFSTLLVSCDETSRVSDVDCSMRPSKRSYFHPPQQETAMEDILKNMVKCYADEEDAISRAANIGPNAPQEVRDVLTALYNNATPDIEALKALGRDKMEFILRPVKMPPHSTILNEAVRQSNYRWVKALLEAGADPNGSGSLMAYTASKDVWHPSSSWAHMFMDGSPAVPFLELYLEYGGDLNTTADGGYGNSPMINASFNNLAARVFLLERGADPWLTRQAPKPRNFKYTMLGRRVFSSLSSDNNEEMYIIIKRGLFRMPPQPVYYPMVHDHYLKVLEMRSDATGPERRHKLWTLQRVVNALIAIKAFEPSPRMLELLASNPIPDDEGGWILREGQLHQDYDDPRVGWVLGSEVW